MLLAHRGYCTKIGKGCQGGPHIKPTHRDNTIYDPNQDAAQDDANVDTYVYVNGKPIALRRNGWLANLHQDQLGNLASATADGIGVTDHKFTGQKRDRHPLSAACNPSTPRVEIPIG